MISYSDLTTKVIQAIAAKFPAAVVTFATPDITWDTMLSTDKDVGITVEFTGSLKQRNETFKGSIWVWSFIGITFVKYSDTIEDDVKAFLDGVPAIFDGDPRLGSTVSLAEITEITKPEPIRINDTPVYWIAFEIKILDKV